MKRELWESIVDLVDSVIAADLAGTGLRIESAAFDMPLNVVLRPTEVGFKFMADAPEWRFESGLDNQPGRLRLRLEEVRHA